VVNVNVWAKEKKCVEEFDVSSLRLSDMKVNVDAEVEKTVVAAGKKFEVLLQAGPKGGVAHWFFRVEKDYNIFFSVDCQEEGKARVVVKQPVKVLAEQGSYAVAGAATIWLVFDNGFSYFTEKTMQYSGIIISNEEKPVESGQRDDSNQSVRGNRQDDEQPTNTQPSNP